MLVSKQLFTCCLLVALRQTSASDDKPAFYNNDIRATVPPSNPEVHTITGETHTIMIEISNYAETSLDVVVQAGLPEYAKMTIFSMNFEEWANMEKNSEFQEPHEVSQQTNDGSALNANPTRNIYSNAIETAGSTVVKTNNKMTFDLGYKETPQNFVSNCSIDLNSADITIDISGIGVEHMLGMLYSPNHPEPYPNNADITWLVKVTQPETLRLNIVDLNLEGCCDRLTVYDGDSSNSEILAVLTGTLGDMLGDFSTTILESTGSSLFLHLTSDCSVTNRGFKAMVDTGICSRDWYDVDCCPRTQGEGLYTLASGEEAFCSNGWAVFQRRIDGSITDYYSKSWEEYAEGFGNMSGEFWLGLRKIHQNTKQGRCRLRVDLQSFDNDTAYEEYSQFSVADEADLFRISVGGYSGTAGDSLTEIGNSSRYNINGMAFSTNERDNDMSTNNCAAYWYTGGWWNNACFSAAPNGEYRKTSSDGFSMKWNTFKGNDPMKFIQMGVRCD